MKSHSLEYRIPRATPPGGKGGKGGKGGEIALTLTASPMGRDWCVKASGGSEGGAHIGAVALAVPRPSKRQDGSLSATASLLSVVGHEEDLLARHMALTLAKGLGVTVLVVCGIHVDGANENDLRRIEDAMGTLTGRLLNSLSQKF